MFRKLLLGLLIVGAVAGPYLYFEKGWRTSLAQQAGSWIPGKQQTDQPTDFSPSPLTGDPAEATRRAMYEPAMHDIYAVFRFDRSVPWVMANWKRVSIFDSEQQLRGMRVPLVTGTQPDDLVGALTYYFDEDEKLQRITFHGTTKDDRKIVQLLTNRFHLKHESTYGKDVYASKWHGEPLSVLQVTAPPVRRQASQPMYDVSCELNWPNGTHRLSAAVQKTTRDL